MSHGPLFDSAPYSNETTSREAAVPQPKGETFDKKQDGARLKAQFLRVLNVVTDGQWWTLRRVAAITGDGEASISARFRDIDGWNGWKKERRRVEGERGLHEYRFVRAA